MATNIIKHLQDYLGAHLEKIDPNTQTVDPDTKHHSYDLLAQAAIPAVLVAFYKHTRSSEGAVELANDNGKRDPLDYLLHHQKLIVVQRVADFAGVGSGQSEDVMDAVADECVRFVRNELGSAFNAENLQKYFASQRQTILMHLPEDLQMGELLNDNTLDDRTNKMRGPASGLAQSISNLFSSTGIEKEP